jgi:hypothetical protein
MTASGNVFPCRHLSYSNNNKWLTPANQVSQYCLKYASN